MPTLGLLCDPDFPQQVAQWLSEISPDTLAEHLDGGDWNIEVVCDPISAGRGSGKEILHAVQQQGQQANWDYAVCLTDLPLRVDRAPVLADVDVDNGVGLISLPALGLLQPYRRAGQMLLQLLDEITGATDQSGEKSHTQRRRGLHSRLTNLLAPIKRETPHQDEIGVRYRATQHRGRVRLLSGMVRTNSPWRLVLGMRRALAAAIATSAFGLSSSTIWMISHELQPTYQAVAAIASIAVLVIWLITAHDLWEQVGQTADRELRWLYNASTLSTLTIGVSCFYLALLIINFGVAAFLVPSKLLISTLSSPVHVGTYLALAWGFTTMGVVAGALGSSLETDQAVRQAAYGYRESQRRRNQQSDQDADSFNA